MTTAAERKRAIELWAREGATLDEVIEALVKVDQAARCWAVAQASLPPDVIRPIETAQAAMLRMGSFDEFLPHDGSIPPT